MKNSFTRILPLNDNTNESPIWRTVFVVLLLGSLVLLPLLARNAGISADEGRYYNQAKQVYQYYASGGKDKSAVEQETIDAQHYNTQSFDLAMVVLENVFHPDDPYQMRHFFTALSGWLVLLFSALFIAQVAGYRAACLTLFLLFISPRLLGHAYNNNKEIPQTVAFVAATYFMMLFFRDFPRRSMRNTIGITLAIASGISIRIGALVLIPYFLLFAGLYFLATTPFRQILTPDSLRKAGRLLATVILVLVCSFSLGILPWPFGLEGPFSNTLEVLKAMSSLGVSITQIFEGKQIWSNEIPWYYSIKYMAITIPSVIFVGIILFAVFSPRIVKRTNAMPLFILAFSWLFPIIYAAASIKNDYGGWRHLMFVYPPMVGLAAIGFDALLKRLPKQSFKYAAGAVILLLCFHPVSHIIRNHPHEYVYFNELFGGVDKANGYYETDYYQHSIRAASEWLEKHLSEELAEGKEFIIGKNDGPVPHYLHHLKGQVKVQHTYGYYTRSKYDWDYGLFYVGYISPYQLQNGLWPPEGTIHSIKVDNTPICAIVKRPSREDFLGHEALNKNDIDGAIEHFKSYLAADPKNESAHGAIASAYLAKADFGPALHHANEALRYHPGFTSALDMKGRTHLQLKQYDQAIETFSKLSKKVPSYNLPFYFMAIAYMHKGNPDAAIQMGNEAIRRNPRFAPAYQLVAAAYRQKGNTNAAQAYNAQAQKIKATTQQ